MKVHQKGKPTFCIQYLYRKSQAVRRSDITNNDVKIFGLEGSGIAFFDGLNFLFCLFVIILPDLQGAVRVRRVRKIDHR